VCTRDDFLTFMRKAKEGINAQGGWVSQASYIARECGSPCTADHILHTESLTHDWHALLTKLKLPIIALPHSNPTAPQQVTPPTIFTQEVCDIIHSLDESLFEEFGYKKRKCPFELE